MRGSRRGPIVRWSLPGLAGGGRDDRNGWSMDAVERRRGTEWALVGVSLAQLACGLVGMAVAIRHGHAYDVGFMKGSPERVARDSILTGTALSAPVAMLASQAALTTVVAARGSERAASGLQVLGVLMVSGYLAERLVRHRLSRRGWEPFESPLVAAGVGLAVAMCLLGRQAGVHRPEIVVVSSCSRSRADSYPAVASSPPG